MIKDGKRNTKKPKASSRIEGRNDSRLTRVKMRNSDGPYCHSMECPKCSLGQARLIKNQISSFLSYSKHVHLCFLWKNRVKIASSASSARFPWCWALRCHVDNIYCQPDNLESPRDLRYGISFIRLACGRVSRASSWVLVDVVTPISLWVYVVLGCTENAS